MVPPNDHEQMIWELYRAHRISCGKATELFRTTKSNFLRMASELGIPYIDYDAKELQLEFQSAETLALFRSLHPRARRFLNLEAS